MDNNKSKELRSILDFNKEQGRILMLEKGKKGFQRMIFGRSLFILLCTLAQFALFLSFFTVLKDYLSILLGSYYVFVILILMVIINRNMNPAMKVPWILVCMLLPVVGGMLYLYVELDFSNRIFSSRVEELIKQTQHYVREDPDVRAGLAHRDPGLEKLSRYLVRYGNNRLFDHTQVSYYDSGEDMFPHLIEALESAEHYIFLEFFIVKEGLMWGRILKILQEKAAQGLEVRVLYDGFNTLTNLPVNYQRELAQLGIHCKVFSPIRPIFSSIYNNRDHRKILVIDGKVGFCGGVNLSDEYINQWERFGYWKDAAVMLKGHAVQGLTQLFLQMWNITEKNPDYGDFLKPEDNGYLHPTDTLAEQMDGSLMEKEYDDVDLGFVQPYGDSPLDEELVGRNVYMYMINRAMDHVQFMTPYLILDHEMSEALCFTAKRGVKVRLILPHIPDKKVAYALAKSHYRELITAGVEIYEFLPGFMHAKVAESDDEIAVVGSINLDYRSFYYHFENAVLMYRNPAIKEIKKDFEETLAVSKRITLDDVKNETLFMKALGFVTKAIAPLM